MFAIINKNTKEILCWRYSVDGTYNSVCFQPLTLSRILKGVVVCEVEADFLYVDEFLDFDKFNDVIKIIDFDEFLELNLEKLTKVIEDMDS